MHFLVNFFPTSGQIITIDILTLIFLAIILLNLFMGLVRGFLKELISFFGFFLVLLGAFLLCKPIGGLFNNLFGNAFASPIYNFLVGKSDQFAQVMTQEAANEALPSLLSGIKVPSFLQAPIIKYVVGCIPAESPELAVGTYVANSMALLACSAIAFIAVAIVLIIVLVIITKLTKKINHVPVLGWLNKLLGALLGILAGIVVVAGIGSLISMMSGMEFMQKFLVETLKVPLEDPNRWSFAKVFIENDLINMVIGSILK